MAVIGITGGAGSGKSFVAKLAAENFDMLHIDTDRLARTQMMPGGASYAGVAQAFPDCLKHGRNVPDDRKTSGDISTVVSNETNGEMIGAKKEKTADNPAKGDLPEIDRAALAARVFNDSEALEKLESLTHPHVRETVESLIEGSKGLFSHVLIETAILADAGYCPLCDAVWYVTAPEEDRKKRLTERGYDEVRIKSVFGSQPTDERYRETSTYEIKNGEDADESDLLEQIKSIMKDMGIPETNAEDEDEEDDDDDDERR